MEEMRSALLLDSDQPVLGFGSVCHTDGAKAYRTLKTLCSTGLEDGDLRLSHTCVKQASPPRILQENAGACLGRRPV